MAADATRLVVQAVPFHGTRQESTFMSTLTLLPVSSKPWEELFASIIFHLFMQEGEGREGAGGLGLASRWALPLEVVYPGVASGCGVAANREDALETQILSGPTAVVFPLRCHNQCPSAFASFL